MPSNYGDVALQLPPDWSRESMAHSPLVVDMVGHTDGKADIHLTCDEDARHQFQWVDHNNKVQMSLWKLKGYTFVRRTENEDSWAIDEQLFSWDAEDYCINGQGLRSMARPAALWEKEQAELAAKTAAINKRRSDTQSPTDIATAVRQARGDEPLVDHEHNRVLRRKAG